MKSLLNLRFLYKINSKRIIEADKDLYVTYDEAIRNDEVISLASSTTLRMIDEINGHDFWGKEKKIKELKKEIKELNKKKKTITNKNKIKEKIKELHNSTFMSDYLCVVLDTKGDYDKLNKGFRINGVPYVRLLATSGGVKKSTVVYCSERVHGQLYKQLNAERNPEKKFVPAKLEAYISLACSASYPVSVPRGVLVVGDVETTFKDSVIEIDGQLGGRPSLKEIDDYEVKLSACDGLGLMMPSLAEQWGKECEEDYLMAGCCLRQAFTKGMVFTFDFQQFAEEVAKNYIVKDVWGEEHDIRNIELVLTTSMLKLWDSYESVNDWLDKSLNNGHTFAITKITPEKLDEEQTLNYQFIQSLDLSEEDIKELCEPFLETVEGVMNKDYRKSLLYLRGVDLKEKTVLRPPFDYTTAMMLDESMLNDPYVYSKIKHNIKNRIDRAKMGVLPVRGNFSIISGDPYLLCEYIFGMTPKGLLKAGEFYSAFWNEKGVDKTVAMRAPMTSHNNIQICKMVNNEEVNKWYKYMNTVYILNAWDTTCAKLNGADMDGDTFFTTDNPVILRNVYPTKAIMCVQSSSTKCIPTEKDFIVANKRSFGNLVGTITNYATSMYTVITNFEKGSQEEQELTYRILCMQDFQQNSIDMAKGVEYRPVPKEWYDWKSNKILEDDEEDVVADKEFNQLILANKKPYFMIYNYDKLKSEYNKYKKANDIACHAKFGISLEELRDKQNKTDKEKEFYEVFAQQCPVNVSPSVVNKIAWYIENHFANKDLFEIEAYDIEKLKDKEVTYSTQKYNKVAKIREEYSESMRTLVISNLFNKERVERMMTLRENMRNEILEVCDYNEAMMCNVLVDLCYSDAKSKDLLWETCGEQLIKNMVKNGYSILRFPCQSEGEGEFTFKGLKFEMREVDVNEINW